MSKGYWIASYHAVSDSASVTRYAEAATPILLAFGARFLARGMPVRAYEGGVMQRCVVIEFPSVDEAVAAYESPAYQAVLGIMRDAMQREVRIVPGVD